MGDTKQGAFDAIMQRWEAQADKATWVSAESRDRRRKIEAKSARQHVAALREAGYLTTPDERTAKFVSDAEWVLRVVEAARAMCDKTDVDGDLPWVRMLAAKDDLIAALNSDGRATQ